MIDIHEAHGHDGIVTYLSQKMLKMKRGANKNKEMEMHPIDNRLLNIFHLGSKRESFSRNEVSRSLERKMTTRAWKILVSYFVTFRGYNRKFPLL